MDEPIYVLYAEQYERERMRRYAGKREWPDPLPIVSHYEVETPNRLMVRYAGLVVSSSDLPTYFRLDEMTIKPDPGYEIRS